MGQKWGQTERVPMPIHANLCTFAHMQKGAKALTLLGFGAFSRQYSSTIGVCGCNVRQLSLGSPAKLLFRPLIGIYMSKFDICLSRATSLSQLILVGVAIFTLYYTAIPLYQKELASEQLAKIQIEQAAAEERLSFINSSYQLQVEESERMRKQKELLAGRLELEQQHLAEIQLQIKVKDDELSSLRLALQKTSESIRVVESKLASASRLKFVQAVEWFALQAQLSKECELTIIGRDDRKNVDDGGANIPKCDPLNSIISAIDAAAEPNAKDQSGDSLGLSKLERDKWYRRAMQLVNENKVSLADVVDRPRLEALLNDSERYQLDVSKKKVESYASAVESTLALISYGSEVSEARIKIIGSFVEVLKLKL